MKFHPLKSAREARQWSQNKIAEEVGVSVRTVRRWEQGLVMPTPYYRKQLCVLFGKTAKELGLSSDSSESQVSSSITYPSKLDSSREDTVEGLSAVGPELDSSREDTVEDLSAVGPELDSSAEGVVNDLPATEQESSSYQQARYKTPPLTKSRNAYHSLFARTQSGKKRLLELTILLLVTVILIGIALWPSGMLRLNIWKIPGVTNTSPTSSATDSSAETKVEPQVHSNCPGSGWQSHTSDTYGQYYTVKTNSSSFCYQATWSMPNNLTAAKSCDFHIISYPGSNATVRYYFFTNHRDTVYVNITQTSLDWSYFPKFLDVNFIELEIDDSQSGTIISVGPFFIQNCHPY